MRYNADHEYNRKDAGTDLLVEIIRDAFPEKCFFVAEKEHPMVNITFNKQPYSIEILNNQLHIFQPITNRSSGVEILCLNNPDSSPVQWLKEKISILNNQSLTI